jgi:magnesium-transporting ATPase (P-type)
LHAIQNLGAMDVLCTDKTGTLTQDRIILERYVDVDGEPSERVLELAYLNSYYQSGLKNLLDVAVLKYTEVHARLHAEGQHQKVDEIPFDFERRRMSVVVEGPGGRQLICKGAVEEVFAACTQGERVVSVSRSMKATWPACSVSAMPSMKRGSASSPLPTRPWPNKVRCSARAMRRIWCWWAMWPFWTHPRRARKPPWPPWWPMA